MQGFFYTLGPESCKPAQLFRETWEHLEPPGTCPVFGGSCGGVASDTKQC